MRDVDSSDLMLVSSVRNLKLRKTEKIVKHPEQKRKETSLEQNLHPRTVRFDSRIQINDSQIKLQFLLFNMLKLLTKYMKIKRIFNHHHHSVHF